MPSLFGSDTMHPKGKYRELGQSASDDEFSLSDDEKVLFKKSGEIELNLCPETRIHRAKRTNKPCGRFLAICCAIFVVVVAVVTVIAVYMSTHGVKPWTDHAASETQTSQLEPVVLEHTRSEGGWKIVFKNMGGEGSARLLDVDGDGVDDVIFASASSDGSSIMRSDTSTKFDGLHKRCESKGLAYPCMGYVVALSGLNGSVLWTLRVRSEAFVLNCEDFDINKDGKKDCIATGRLAQLTAFDPYLGEVLWTCEDDDVFEAYWNMYHAAALPDWDGDGVPEVLVANGGNASKPPDDYDRKPGRLVVLSGATGSPLRTRYLEIPDSKETYMSPVMYTPIDDGPTYILLGSGGETVSGNLFGISLRDFCNYILADDPEACKEIKTGEYTETGRDENGLFVIYKGKEKGVMVPPVVVDYDSDGVRDILMTAFEGKVNLYSGQDLSLVWSANFTGMETYGTPAPGYFDDDDYLDFMVTWNMGAWMSYNSSLVTVISGKNGSVLWSLQSSEMQMASPFSISTNLSHQDSFLFKVQGREAKIRQQQGGRKKRHGISAPVEFRKKQMNSHLKCADDLSAFKGEVFVMDRNTVTTPVSILELPRQKHIYDANLKCTDTPPPMSNHLGQPSSSNYLDDDDNNDDDVAASAAADGNDDEDDDDHDDISNDNPNNDDSNGYSNMGGETSNSTRKRRKDDKVKTKKMCAVDDPDMMSSGIIGEVDGDGQLDYISATSSITMLYDAEFCHQGMKLQFIVQKVSMEKGILDGTFEQVPVKAKLSMKDSGVNSLVKKEKTFLPMAQQRWTQYFGTNDRNVYR